MQFDQNNYNKVQKLKLFNAQLIKCMSNAKNNEPLRFKFFFVI